MTSTTMRAGVTAAAAARQKPPLTRGRLRPRRAAEPHTDRDQHRSHRPLGTSTLGNASTRTCARTCQNHGRTDTTFTNMCDRHSAEWYLFYQLHASSWEVASSLESFGARFKHRLRDGRVTRWHLDNDLAYQGPDVKDAAEELVTSRTQSVAYEKNNNPVSERNIGVVEYAIKAACAHAGAPMCLWPWAATQFENIAYFISTRAHAPPMSPFRFGHADAPAPDLEWARPLFCDVIVHVASRDQGGKMNYTGAVGCFLCHDFKRNAEIVYVPSLRRLSTFTVTTWRMDSFEVCKMITVDTPLEYRETEDLRCLWPRDLRPATQEASGTRCTCRNRQNPAGKGGRCSGPEGKCTPYAGRANGAGKGGRVHLPCVSTGVHRSGGSGQSLISIQRARAWGDRT